MNAWSSSQTGEHTKRFPLEPNVELTKSLLPLKKTDFRVIVGMITGHTTLVNSYKKRIGIRDDPDCDRCNGVQETAEHLLCFCRRNLCNKMCITYAYSLDALADWSIATSMVHCRLTLQASTSKEMGSSMARLS